MFALGMVASFFSFGRRSDAWEEGVLPKCNVLKRWFMLGERRQSLSRVRGAHVRVFPTQMSSSGSPCALTGDAYVVSGASGRCLG